VVGDRLAAEALVCPQVEDLRDDGSLGRSSRRASPAGCRPGASEGLERAQRQLGLSDREFAGLRAKSSVPPHDRRFIARSIGVK